MLTFSHNWETTKKLEHVAENVGTLSHQLEEKNKDELEESINLSREKLTKILTNQSGFSNISGKKKKQKKSNPSTSYSEPQSEAVIDDSFDGNVSLINLKHLYIKDAECIFCQENFSKSLSKEMWEVCYL